MPGPISDSYEGPPDHAPYVPSWCYPKGPRICPCGHHEGFHGQQGMKCLHAASCGCEGLPPECFTPDEDLHPDA